MLVIIYSQLMLTLSIKRCYSSIGIKTIFIRRLKMPGRENKSLINVYIYIYMLASNAVDHGFDSRSGHTKDDKIGIC